MLRVAKRTHALGCSGFTELYRKKASRNRVVTSVIGAPVMKQLSAHISCNTRIRVCPDTSTLLLTRHT